MRLKLPARARAACTCASLLALMRSASSLCVHSVVNSASLVDDDGMLPVRVWTVLELTRPSRTCSAHQVFNANLAGKLKRGTHLVEQGDERRIFLSEGLRMHASDTNQIKSQTVCFSSGKTLHLLQLCRVVRAENHVPRIRLERETDRAVPRHGRQLEKISAGNNLNASKRFIGVPHSPGELLGEGECGGVEHADLVDDECAAAAPSLAEVAVTEPLCCSFAARM